MKKKIEFNDLWFLFSLSKVFIWILLVTHSMIIKQYLVKTKPRVLLLNSDWFLRESFLQLRGILKSSGGGGGAGWFAFLSIRKQKSHSTEGRTIGCSGWIPYRATRSWRIYTVLFWHSTLMFLITFTEGINWGQFVTRSSLIMH